MIMFKPTLIVTRLVIKRQNHIAYDEKFHAGVNIIRGKNGSGKTTIMASIVYALGGDIKKKKDEFKLCDHVYLELQLNGVVYTFRRKITDGYPPLDIFEGCYEEAISNPDLWVTYSNRRTDNQKSYSEIIFSLLGLPEEKTESDGNVTINDLLRLIYEDQQTSSDKIFLAPDFPEGASKRQAISDLLLGIDDYELHQLRRKLTLKEKNFSQYEGQLTQIYNVLGSADVDVNISSIQAEKHELLEEQRFINGAINLLYSEHNQDATKEAEEQFAQIKAYLTKLKQQISQLEQDSDSLIFDIEDSKEFIDSLDVRLDALNVSTEVTRTLGGIDFSYCPCCLQVLSDSTDSKKCDLCKSEIKDEGRALGYLKMRNEISFQKRESTEILIRKEEKLSKTKASIQKLKAQKIELERSHSNFINSLNPIEAKVKDYISRLGYIDRAIQDTLTKEELAQKVDAIKRKKAQLNNEISSLKDEIKAANSLRDENRSKIYTEINDLTLELLKSDPSNELKNIDRISFDFGKDEVIAVGKESPAASTGTYLKNSFFFSLFLVSLTNEQVRYPRFIIMDNIEDSGLETDRVQQFHNDIIKFSDESNVLHQIIFSARSEVIASELNNSDLCIGKSYRDEAGEYSLSITSN